MKQAELEITDRDVASVNESLATRPPNEMELIQSAVLRGAPIETIERLVALKERMMAHDAEGQFNISMNAAQSELGRVAADLTNPQTKSKYASYAALDRKVRPVYTKHGFSLSFDTGDSPTAEMVRVLCYCSHSAGHTRTYRVDMPSDGKGAKGGDVMTKTHATGAAVSYGRRYLLNSIFNIAIGEEDSDGNGENMPDNIVDEFIQNIKGSGDTEQLQKRYFEAFKKATVLGDVKAGNAFVLAKDARKKELDNGRN